MYPMQHELCLCPSDAQQMLDTLEHFIAELDPQDAESVEVIQLAQALAAKIISSPLVRISVLSQPISQVPPRAHLPSAYNFAGHTLRPDPCGHECDCPLACVQTRRQGESSCSRFAGV